MTDGRRRITHEPRRITRRRALGETLGAVGAATLTGGLLAGCGAAGAGRRADATGSTLQSTWDDPVGDGQLRVLAGEPLIPREELGAPAPLRAKLATLAHVTDSHVLDASSPARVTFLDRLGPPFQSTFRPQETLTTQVLAGALRAIRALAPDAVIQGGDLIDNDQHNELEHALAVLRGDRVTPGSGGHGYYGVQLSSDADPFYYRPAVDAPRYPQLLRDAVTAFEGPGVGAPLLPVFGDHDGLVAGTVVPTPLTRSLAVGGRALWDLPAGLQPPAGLGAGARGSPDGPPDPGVVDALLAQALRGPTVRVPPDQTRRQLSFAESVSRLAGAGGPGVAARPGARLDYALDLGARMRVIVLDLARRGGGSGGEVDAEQPAWISRQLASAGSRWVLLVTHQPLVDSVGGEAILAELDRAPRVAVVLNGHTHRNAITPRRTPAGGYWLIGTASLIDYPQQARALELRATAGGGIAIRTWMLDHVGDGLTGRLGLISRRLSYLDAQGGRPEGFAGRPRDRNVVLYRRAPARA
jgi:3',5'-cyclic AMP phosphodiesterase CpdA